MNVPYSVQGKPRLAAIGSGLANIGCMEVCRDIFRCSPSLQNGGTVGDGMMAFILYVFIMAVHVSMIRRWVVSVTG